MASSKYPRPLGVDHDGLVCPARTPGPLGLRDQADPNVIALLGDTPGPLGVGDYGQPILWQSGDIGKLIQGSRLMKSPALSSISFRTNATAQKKEEVNKTDDAINKQDPSWPPPPENLIQPSLSRAQSLLGTFKYIAAPTSAEKRAIKITDDWEKKNIIRVTIPQLKGIKGYHSGGVIRFHRLAANQLLELWAAWEQQGLLPLVLSFGGAFTPRYIGGTKVLSNHALGAAFDINTTYNPQGKRPLIVGEKGSVRELVPLANEYGFYWGGHFGGTRVDGQHFEIAELK